MSDRYFYLLSKHQRIDDELRMEQLRSRPDFTRLQKLKRMKLAIKDRLHALMRKPVRGEPA